MILGLLVSLPKLAHAETDNGYTQLMPMAHTYVTLMLCAGTAFEFKQDEDAGYRFDAKANLLIERSMSSGWDLHQISIATLEATENRQGVVLMDDDTIESFNMRYYSGQPCAKALVRANDMLKGEDFPRP